MKSQTVTINVISHQKMIETGKKKQLSKNINKQKFWFYNETKDKTSFQEYVILRLVEKKE